MPRDTNDHKLNRRNPVLGAGDLVGTSLVDIPLNTELRHNATHVTVIHDGADGAIGSLSLSYDGVDFEGPFPIIAGETMEFFDLDVHTLRLESDALFGDFPWRVVAS